MLALSVLLAFSCVKLYTIFTMSLANPSGDGVKFPPHTSDALQKIAEEGIITLHRVHRALAITGMHHPEHVELAHQIHLFEILVRIVLREAGIPDDLIREMPESSTTPHDPLVPRTN